MADNESAPTSQPTNEQSTPTPAGQPDTVRVAIDVEAGIMPGLAMGEYTRRWYITSADWAKAAEEGKQAELLAELSGKAAGYQVLLQLQPDRLNYVRTTWVWF